MRPLRLACALPLALLATPVFAEMRAEPVEWSIGDTNFSGVLVHDDANAISRPGVVMVPNWMGVTPSAIEKAKRDIANGAVKAKSRSE